MRRELYERNMILNKFFFSNLSFGFGAGTKKLVRDKIEWQLKRPQSVVGNYSDIITMSEHNYLNIIGLLKLKGAILINFCLCPCTRMYCEWLSVN